ncbi:MAG: response regulator [Planctomycetes bacterium]|nr:response regulator [Planctomycetota bacterium]
MHEILIDDLGWNSSLTHSIFHEGGALLHRAGETLTTVQRTSMEASGIRRVYRPDEWEQDREVTHALSTKVLSLYSMTDNAVLATDVVLPSGILLAKEGAVVDDTRRVGLLQHGIREVPVRKSAEERRDLQVLTYRALLRRSASGSPLPVPAGLPTPPGGDPVGGEAEARVPPPGKLPRARVLVADDNRHVRRILRCFLESDGYEVIEAADGAEALQILRQQSIGLVLLDRNMPGMDGLTLIERMSASRLTRDIPVIICSARRTLEDVMGAVARGVKGYILKPFTRSFVLNLVARTLAGGSADDPGKNESPAPNRRHPTCSNR